MSKLYYTDPLKAAYMAREFGVVYDGSLNEFYQDGSAYGYYDLIHDEELLSDGNKQFVAKNYIHPDSLPIFEPQEGDLASWISRCFGVKENFKKIHIAEVFTKDFWSQIFLDKEYKAKIIQRNGKHFFMPESKQPTHIKQKHVHKTEK